MHRVHFVRGDPDRPWLDRRVKEFVGMELGLGIRDIRDCGKVSPGAQIV